MTFVLATLVGLAFGAVDQYLGSLRPMVALGSWTVSVSQMSALWLLLPFLVGRTQDRARSAVILGVVATAAALLGYFLMAVSPLETVPLNEAPSAFAAIVRSNRLWIVGGAVTGPLFGWLGYHWRARRWWVTAALISGAFLLEPLVRYLRRQLVGPSWVWVAESVLGACLVVWFTFVRTRHASVQPA